MFGAEDKGSQKCKILEVELEDGILLVALYFMDGGDGEVYLHLSADVFDSMDTYGEATYLYDYAKFLDYGKGLDVMKALDSKLNPGYDYDYRSVGGVLKSNGFKKVSYR